jgi:hypothetical protein
MCQRRERALGSARSAALSQVTVTEQPPPHCSCLQFFNTDCVVDYVASRAGYVVIQRS